MTYFELSFHRISPIGQPSSSSTLERSLPRQRQDQPSHYHGNYASPDSTTTAHHHHHTSQQIPVSPHNIRRHHPGVDQGYRADSQSSVGPESAYCGSETHDPPLPVPSRIQMGTGGRHPVNVKDIRRKPVNAQLTVAPSSPAINRNQRVVAYQNGHNMQNSSAQRTPQHQRLPVEHNHHSPKSTNMQNGYEPDTQSESSTRSSQHHHQPTHYHQMNGGGRGGDGGSPSGGSGHGGRVSERPVAIDQTPPVEDEDEMGMLPPVPPPGPKMPTRPMLG